MSIFDTWKGTIELNGSRVDTLDFNRLNVGDGVKIHLTPVGFKETERKQSEVVLHSDDDEYIIKVRAWMTKPSTPDFDFMDKFNKGIPMPLRVMVGTVNKETEKMFHMTLHGDILQEVTQTCMCCGKPITNEVSKYFGLGPVCGSHNYVNPFSSKEELKKAVGEYRTRLQNTTWDGWIPKSAIESKTRKNIVDND